MHRSECFLNTPFLSTKGGGERKEEEGRGEEGDFSQFSLSFQLNFLRGGEGGKGKKKEEGGGEGRT